MSVPVLVVYDRHGGIQEVQSPGSGSLYPQGIRRLFPPRVQEIIFARQIDFQALADHLALRHTPSCRRCTWTIEGIFIPGMLILIFTRKWLLFVDYGL